MKGLKRQKLPKMLLGGGSASKKMGKAQPGMVGGSIGMPAPRRPKRYTRAK